MGYRIWASLLHLTLSMKHRRKIIVALIATAIIGYGIVKDNKESSIPHPTSSTQQPIQFNNSYTSPHHQSLPQGTLNLDRDEVLKKSLKGYREEIYWGREHPIIETTKDLNDKEFTRFVEDEIKSKDVDVYWGAEY